MAKLLLAGYFGAGNLGDDAILTGFVHGIDGLDFQFRVLCGSPELLMRNLGLQGIGKKDFAGVKNAIQECDALVFPGGSIFQDVTSVKSVAYYSKLVSEAKKANKRVIMLGQGVGPLTSWTGKRMGAAAFNAADILTVRDPMSVSALKALGVNQLPRVTADSAFLLPPPVEREESSTQFGVAGMKTIGLSARPWGKDKNKTVISVFGDIIKLMTQNGYVPVLMPMDSAEDGALGEAIAKLHGGKVPELKGLTTPMQFQQRVGRMEAVVAMRLHAGILASTMGIPPFMISYDPKVTAFANVMGLQTPPTIQGATGDRIFGQFQAFIKDRDQIAATVLRKRDEQIKAAQGNIQALRDCMGV